MKNVLKILVALLAVTPLYVHSGGDPEYVEFPEDYDKAFTQYATANRANQKQVAKLYANETAIASYQKSQRGAPGSVVVMEIYSPKTDAEGKPVPGDDGIFVIDSLAAVAVMEKRDDWNEAYPVENRVGNWGFAVYNPDGTEKSNDLNCVECHTPLSSQDYLFTYHKLVDFVKNH